MERQVHYLVRLVDDLLDLSRISHGTFELRKEVCDLSVVVQNAVETSSSLVKQRGHTLKLELPADPLWVEGDSVRLTQIVANLLNNAARYTEVCGQISVVAQQLGKSAEVTVTDTGIGFDPRDCDKMFEMFGRGQTSSGLGIGLALSRRLAEMHGGSLQGNSRGPGQGAQFALHLTRAIVSEAPKAVTAALPVAGGATVRVLVVDDNEDAADTMKLLLGHLGAEVAVAYDGEAGIEAFDSFRASVVFVDIGMPGMDGYELARALRERFSEEPPMIVGLSGWGQEEDMRRGREAGFDRHLVKPADLAQLSAVLNHARERRAAPRQRGEDTNRRQDG